MLCAPNLGQCGAGATTDADDEPPSLRLKGWRRDRPLPVEATLETSATLCGDERAPAAEGWKGATGAWWVRAAIEVADG